MSIVRRIPAFLLTAFLFVAVTALPAVAQEDAPTETTVASTGGAVGEPAVVAPEPSSLVAQDDWTYRFLIPTLIALAIVVVAGTTVQYFLQVVRKRYKVVE